MKIYHLFKAITCIKMISLTFLTCSFLLYKNEVAHTESLVECGQTYNQDVQKGSLNGEPANVKKALWAHGGCHDFYTKTGVFKFMLILEWKDGCEGSYGNCGVMGSYLNGERVRLLGEFDGPNSSGWKFKSRGGIYRAIIYK